MERLHIFALGLLIFSIALTITSHIILSNIPLTALGIGLMILASSILLTPLQSIPPKAVRAMLEGSILSLEAILEEFDVSRRGYYVRADDDRVYLYVPLGEDRGPPAERAEPSGLIHEEGGSRYLVLIPPASELIRIPEISGASLDSALTYMLVDLLEVADSVDVVSNGVVTIRLKNVKSHVTAGRFKSVFGSLEASIAACLTANLIGVVRVSDEILEGNSKVIILEVREHE